MEPLLRMMEKAISPGDVVGSFADDIALVMQNLLFALPRLLVVFKVFGLASGLKLNLLNFLPPQPFQLPQSPRPQPQPPPTSSPPLL